MKFFRAIFSLFLFVLLLGANPFSFHHGLVHAGTPSQDFGSLDVDDIFSTPDDGKTDNGDNTFSYQNLITDSQGNEPGGGNKIIAAMLNIIDILLLLISSFAFLAIAYGGFLFMQAGGDEAKVDSGKSILSQAIKGLVIAFSSYLVVRFIESLFS